MTARETILAAVRANQPQGEYHLPDLPDFTLEDSGDKGALFLRNLEAMGGHHYANGISTVMRDLFPDAKVIVSTVPELHGNRDIISDAHARSFADVDVAVVRAAFGVAETGSVLLVDQALISNAIAYLAQHLVILLDPADIVLTLQDAYRRSEFHRHRYASFHTGPSATADIEGVLIHGAQGVRSLTVLLT
ncbi:MAG: LUD domain-containing protein [Bradyrhizobium sp.]